jgi:hypothetical protein
LEIGRGVGSTSRAIPIFVGYQSALRHDSIPRPRLQELFDKGQAVPFKAEDLDELGLDLFGGAFGGYEADEGGKGGRDGEVPCCQRTSSTSLRRVSEDQERGVRTVLSGRATTCLRHLTEQTHAAQMQLRQRGHPQRVRRHRPPRQLYPGDQLAAKR